jgi:hypothetical protein
VLPRSARLKTLECSRLTESIDPVTTALTGKLPFYLSLAAALTFPIALAVLRLYARAVRRSMRSQAHSVPTAPRATDAAAIDGSRMGAHAATLRDLAEPSVNAAADTLFARLLAGPRRAALVYAGAGLGYGVVMAASRLLADGLQILPVRFLFLVWVFSWPVVLTIGIVAVTTRRVKAMMTVAYFLGLMAIGAFAMSRSPDLTWPQVFLPWVLSDLPATLLLLTFLSRKVRAVGPLILVFMLLALIGSDVLLSVVGSRDRYLHAVLEVTSPLGLGGTGTFIAMMVLGFLMFAVWGWIALVWIGRRYQAKKISDESVTVDAVWMLFGLVQSMDLVFGGPLWMFGGLAAFAAYKLLGRLGFWWLGAETSRLQARPILLVLRSFSIGSDSERLFDIVGGYWRRIGSIQMIAGVDLVSRTVEPHEFLAFVSGRLSRRFIDGEDSLNHRMSERDIAADRDRRFRVNEFFCYDDTWKTVLSRLVHDSDVVMMDLRGFSRHNAGCIFELHELARLVPLERVVFVVDRRTDETLLAETLGGHSAGVFRMNSMAGIRIRQLLRAVAVAAT